MRVERVEVMGYTLLQRLRIHWLQEIPGTTTMEGMGKLGLNRLHRLVISAGVVAILCGLQGLTSPEAMATSPNGRMNPDERHRLRQEVRQHSGNYPRQPTQAAPMPNPPTPMVVPQGGASPQQSIPQPVQSAPGANPDAGRLSGPGRLSEDDRRALRQQLREQRMQR